jgi:hypothetical protein
LRKGDFTRTAAFGAKRTFNKNRCSRQVSFVRIWKLEVAPDYRRVSGVVNSPDQIISFHPSKTAGSAAHLDRSNTPAIPGMHAPPHHVAAAIAIVGIVVVGIIVIIVAVVGVRVA